MVSQASIDLLVNMIGFGSIVTTEVPIDNSNKTGTSGRTFSFFHQLVNIDNIYNCVKDRKMDTTTFNSYLLQLKIDAVKSVISCSGIGNGTTDYSTLVNDNLSLFEDAIGYSMSIMVVELLLSSNRITNNKLNSDLTYDKLRLDLEGLKNENGFTTVWGMRAKAKFACNDVKKLFFPKKEVAVYDGKFW